MKRMTALRLVILCFASASTAAMAQSEPARSQAAGGLEDIVVTATKRSENLQVVPVAVSAISSSELTKAGVFETSDLNHSMPNLQVSSPYGEAQPNFSLRGVGVGTEFNANAASPVGVYVDEVYQAFRASHGQQLYDLEQIEVVRGPQGTLFGRNTTGGAINFISRAPKLEGQNGNLTVGYGNYDRFNVQGALEVTPIADKFGIRVAATYVNADPFVRNRLPAGVNAASAFGLSGLNRTTGKDYGGYQSYGVRATFRLRASETVDLSLKLYAGESKGGTEGPIATGQSKNSDVIDWRSPNFLLAPLFQALVPAGLLPGTYSASANGLTDQELEGDTVGKALTNARGVVFNAKINLSDDLKLISISGFDDGKYLQEPTECDGTPMRLCAITYDSKFKAFNQDLRLDFAQGPLKVIFGAYYGRDEVTANNKPDFFNFLRDVNATVGVPASFFNPGGAFGALMAPGTLPTGVTALQHFKQIRTSYAVYGEGSYELTDTIKITAGLRYTSDKNKFREGLTTYYDDTGVARMITVSDFKQGGAFAPYFLQNVTEADGTTVVIPSLQGLGIPLPGPLENDGKSNRLSGRAIIDWKPMDGVLVYASYSRGYRAGTFNGLAYGSANQVYFVKPEQVNAYELGFKTRFMDNRLQINGSLFYYDYKGQQGQVVDATATANLISLDGKLKGLELDVQFQATDRLKLGASLGLIDSKYNDTGGCPATPVTGFPAQQGSCVVSSGGAVDVSGNPFPYAAKSSANFSVDWDALDIGDGVLTLHGDAAYTGRFYYDSFKDYSRGVLTNVTTGKFANGEGDYWVFNSRLTYNMDRFSISAWVKNLTDEVYYPFGIALENLFGNGYRVRSQPRTYGMEATIKF